MATRETPPNELDRSLDCLSHPCRRRILAHLVDAGPRDGGEFAPEAVATEGDDLEQLTTGLHHVHLPKLDAAGYVAWDATTRTLRRGPRFHDVEPLLRLMHDHRDTLPGAWS